MDKNEAIEQIMQILYAYAFAEGSGRNYDGNPEEEIRAIINTFMYSNLTK